jgi:hypothetical protein
LLLVYLLDHRHPPDGTQETIPLRRPHGPCMQL